MRAAEIGPGISPWQLYVRALGLLGEERGLAIALAAAGVAVAGVQLAEPVLFGRVVDALSHGSGALRIVALWGALGLFGIFSGVILSVLADRFAHRRRSRLMRDAFEHAISLPASYHSELGSGAVSRTIMVGSDALFWIWLSVLRDQLPALFGVVFLLPAGIAIDPRMAGILAVLALAYTASNVIVIGKTASGQRAVERHHHDVSSRLSDVIGNVVIVQSFTRLSAEIGAMRDLLTALLTARYPVLTWWGVLTVMQRGAATLTMVAVLTLGALLAERGELTVGEIVSFAAFAGLLIGRLDQLSSFVLRTNESLAAVAQLLELLDHRSPIVDVPNAHALERVRGSVRYEAVTFRYGPQPEAAGVYDLSFEVEPGQTVALVGPTGSGKSTSLALLQRLIEPERGQILVDGHEIRAVSLTSLRAAMAVVFQDAGLFNRSIGENIEIGQPGATQAAIEHAAAQAEAHEFAARKPGGYGFVIGERGASLSGGERQRLAVARAILKNAPILILDEATSSLDTETEARIKRALDHLRQGRTTFVIAHRLSTVANADLILVMDRGRIVERGTFASLVANAGLFARLVREGGFTALAGLCLVALTACSAGLQPGAAAPQDSTVDDAGASDPSDVLSPPGFCGSRGAAETDDPVYEVFCAPQRPVIRSLRELQERLDVAPAPFLPGSDEAQLNAPGVVANAVVLGHSTALSGQLVSSINPRVLILGSDTYLAFQRGIQRVELASRGRESDALHFYLVRFEQACNRTERGCSPGDLYTPRIESDWTRLVVEDAEELANTPEDCRQCHQRARDTPQLLMRELESPWTHFFERERLAANPLPGVRGADLVRDYSSAKGDEPYANVPAAMLRDTSAAVLENLVGRQQPLVFDARAIEQERWPSQAGGYASEPRPSPTWDAAYAAFKRGEQLALPYLEQRATDPEKLSHLSEAYRRYRAHEIVAEELPDLADIFPDDPAVRARIGLQTEPDATPAEALIQACGSCHNDVLDQSLTRARFNIDLARLDVVEIELAIARIERPSTAPGAMPPQGARQLDERSRMRLVDYLRQNARAQTPDPALARAAMLGMAGGTLGETDPEYDD